MITPQTRAEAEPRAAGARRIPNATYRLQFNALLGFAQAESALEYLKELGISDCYASPLFKAAPQSTHGYDVCGFDQCNPELGRTADFEHFLKRLQELGLGLLLDIVPNHMAASPANPWWWDVLKHGPNSSYARFFDIDWEQGKLVLPVLGGHYPQVVERGEMRLVHEDGEYLIAYYDQRFPVAPGSIESDSVKGAKKVLDIYAGRPGEARSFDALHSLIQKQHYRLAYWRVASEELNYRRFFDVTDLVALRMDLPETFEASHGFLRRLVQEGKLSGVRIDHPDGLWDPECYFERLREFLQNRDFYVVAEKILVGDERLPETWPIDGTTGYDFLNLLNGTFIDGSNERRLSEIYAQFIGRKWEFETAVYQGKKRILLRSLHSELSALAKRLKGLAAQTRSGQDLTYRTLQEALVEIIAMFPVYRTYIREETVKPVASEEGYIREAVRKARQKDPTLEPGAYDFIEKLLLLQVPEDLSPEGQAEAREFVMRFQQLTGPTMAKGMEDTAFYNYNRLISLNEVGGHPGEFGVSLEKFHRENQLRLKHWTGALLATATHDTKRGEDVRARLNVLSEIPDEWQSAVLRWRGYNHPCKKMLDGEPAPDANDEYLLYQTLLGTWPCEAGLDRVPAEFRERISAYMLKAIKESKAHTSWTEPNAAYEQAMQQFVEEILAPGPGNFFLRDLLTFQPGVAALGQINSLAQLVLKLTCPGVPDIYQGTELWDLSLVDPDNRRPVDFCRRRDMLQSLKERSARGQEIWQELWAQRDTGEIKMFVMHRVLQFRRERPSLFARGEYIPLEAKGTRQQQVCAFLRRLENDTAVVIVPRLLAGLLPNDRSLPCWEAVWGDTFVRLPFNAGTQLRNVLTSQVSRVSEKDRIAGMHLREIFQHCPLAVLEVES